MQIDLRDGGQVLSDIRYHLIWVTRRRRAFLDGAILARTVELLTDAAASIGVEVTRVMSGGDYLVVTIEAPPELAPAMIVARLKRHSASALRREFGALRTLPSIWTRRSLVTTQDDFPQSRIRDFVERQPRNERRTAARPHERTSIFGGSPAIEMLTLAPPKPIEIPEVPIIVDEA